MLRYLITILAAAMLNLCALKMPADASLPPDLDDISAPWRFEDENGFESDMIGDFPDDIQVEADTLVLTSTNKASTEIGMTIKTRWIEPVKTISSDKPYYTAAKLTFQQGSDFWAGASIEKDPGEEDYNDHTSYSALVIFPRYNSRFIIGQYQLRIGHGLSVNTSRSFGIWGGKVDSHTYFRDDIIRPYASWSESTALQGAGIGYKDKHLDLVAWVSQRRRDAHFDDAGKVTSFEMSGLHRTETEVERKNNCLEETWGSYLGVKLLDDRLKAGVFGQQFHWNQPVAVTDQVFAEWNNMGAISSCQVSRVKASFEVSCDAEKRPAQMLAVHTQNQDFSGCLTAYHIAADYFAPLSSSLDFDYGEVSNRKGIYMFSAYRLGRLDANGFMHLYRNVETAQGQSPGGREIYLGSSFDLGKNYFISGVSRWTSDKSSGMDALKESNRCGITAGYRDIDDLSAYVKVRLCQTDESTTPGWMISGKVNCAVGKAEIIKASISTAWGYYSAPDYDTRLYWIVSDGGGFLRTTSLWKEGVIFDVTVEVCWSEWGRVLLKGIYDYPTVEGTREKSSTISVVLTYH